MKLVSRKILQNTGLMFFAALGVLLAPPRTACAAPTGYHNTVLADSPYLYYRFGESSGTTVIDSSVNGFNGTYVNGVTLGLAGDNASGNATFVAVKIRYGCPAGPFAPPNTSFPPASVTPTIAAFGFTTT